MVNFMGLEFPHEAHEDEVQNDDLLCIQKVQNKLLRFLSNVSLKDHQCTESLLEKSKMLSVKRNNAQTKITEFWKAINKDNKDNSFKASLPNNNQEERVSRSKTNGLLNISGSSNGARNSFINDTKMVWNNCPRNYKIQGITSSKITNQEIFEQSSAA